MWPVASSKQGSADSVFFANNAVSIEAGLINPITSVVILSYKNFEQTTQACVRSVLRDPMCSQWEIIIVDNDSGPETRRSLTEFANEFPAVRILLNERNLGFAGGMNSGLVEATGDIICLLNSDTMVAEGAIGRLADRLRANDRLGLAGPVTNAAGNEQKIFVEPAASVDDILTAGRRYMNSGPSEDITAYRLDFCAVALKRQVFDEIGGLDEQFGRGYYEDFDYSLRAKRAGFDLEVAEDAFVYHQGSASFSSVSKELKTMIKANKHRLIRKHGRATLFPHLRDANLSVLRQYAGRLGSGQSVEKYRIRNRLLLAQADRPRSLIKRWRYLRRLAAVEKSLRDKLDFLESKDIN
jgi:GT2 family glycosyltransferase